MSRLGCISLKNILVRFYWFKLNMMQLSGKYCDSLSLKHRHGKPTTKAMAIAFAPIGPKPWCLISMSASCKFR